MKDGTSVWWQVQSRNKQSLALDLKQSAAQDIVRQLAAESDVLIENFRPGAMENWGLGPDDLLALNPRLIMLRVSGYGQTGPYRDRPGFGVVGEAMGGIRHLTAEPGRVPVRVGISLGDTLAALHGVIGILMALHHLHRSGQGQVIDVALYEAVFNCMESLLPEYSAFGAVRGPAGSALPGIAPSNAYLCKDGGYALIACARPRLPVFEGVAWGTDCVLEQSLSLARRAGLSVSMLRTVWDVDTEADWHRWQHDQAGAG
jgi:formyl-CoA transferase